MMWGGSRARVHVYPEPCDMRRSFNGLSGMVREQLQKDPLSGHYFFFMNRSKNYVKILSWDGNGYVLCAGYRSAFKDKTEKGGKFKISTGGVVFPTNTCCT